MVRVIKATKGGWFPRPAAAPLQLSGHSADIYFESLEPTGLI